ncbi:MAG: hypothetical protein QXX15_01190 [Desulfurococcaceae archaeon]
MSTANSKDWDGRRPAWHHFFLLVRTIAPITPTPSAATRGKRYGLDVEGGGDVVVVVVVVVVGVGVGVGGVMVGVGVGGVMVGVDVGGVMVGVGVGGVIGGGVIVSVGDVIGVDDGGVTDTE